MSLKVFHIFFIIVSILFAFGFGIWAIRSYLKHTDDLLVLWSGVASFLVVAILVVYGIKVFRKLQRL